MPRITRRRNYNGFEAKVRRLGLVPLIDEVESTVTGFRLVIEERRHANGTKVIREWLDQGFEKCGGWRKLTSGGIDWSKSDSQGRRVGVEVQVSGRSDLLAVDVLHLKSELDAGELDAGIIIVPDDTLSRFLTDRTPNLRTAIRHLESSAPDIAVQVLAFRHDGTGPALPKAVTNLGKGETASQR